MGEKDGNKPVGKTTEPSLDDLIDDEPVNDDILGELVADKDDVVLQSIAKIARSGVESDKSNKQLIKQVHKEANRKIEEWGEKTERALLSMNEKLERRWSNSSVARILGTRDSSDELLQAMPEADKKFCKQVESMGKTGIFENLPDRDRVVHRAATASFLWRSLKAQSRRLGGDPHSEYQAAKKLAEAFATKDITGVAELTTADNDMGGYWVPDAVARELMRLITDNSIMRQAGVTIIPMTTKTLYLPVEGSNALAVAIVNEATAITDSFSDTHTARVTLTAKKFAGYGAATVEELSDSAVSILTWVQAKLTEMIAAKEDTEALEGSSFTGLDAASGVNEIASATNGSNMKFKDTSGNERGLVHVVFKARSRSTRRGAQWFGAPETLASIVGLVDDNNHPIFQFAAVPGPIPGTLLGFPFQPHDGVLVNRTKGTGTGLTNIYFGPPSQIVFGDRTGMSWSVDESIYFREDAVAMKLTKRTAIACAVPKAFSRWVDVNPV